MPKFKCTTKTKDNKTVKEVLFLSSKEEAINNLRARNLFIISVIEMKEKSVGGLFSSHKGKRDKIKPYDLAFLARNLSTTLSSGVTLLRSLEILSYQAESIKLEEILKKCSEYIKEGLSLSEAIVKYPKVFSHLWRGLLEVGEASGNLPFVLEKLADYLEIRINFEKKIKGALIYPMILFFVAVGAVIIFFKFILPKFTTLFDQFDIELPLVTKVLFDISRLFEKHFILILAFVAVIIFGCLLFTKRPETRKTWDKIKLKIPLIGDLVFIAALERLTSTMFILLDSGLPLIYTLEVVARGTGNSVLEKSLLQVTDRVRDGASLSAEFRKLDIFPLLISEMAKIGEETGSMPQVFNKIAGHYQKDLSTRIERLLTAFEPIMIVLIGIVVGGIVMALFLPLFKLSTLG